MPIPNLAQTRFEPQTTCLLSPTGENAIYHGMVFSMLMVYQIVLPAEPEDIVLAVRKNATEPGASNAFLRKALSMFPWLYN